ncbi:MAG: tRNA pseudouridine(38-40) synthase TruA [Saprospiraceae bacterium]|nr:tRNA pseudouridine(38-40) synthase TruA [Saprospiraceae bacterium]
MRVLLELCYDGTNYFGWQIQPKQISVQQILQEKISQITGNPIELVGCGRTDTGVHASQYFAHLDIDESSFNKLSIYKINAVLPQDISILNMSTIDDQFHARFNAKQRKYIYRIHNNKDPFNRNFSFLYSSINANHLSNLNKVAEIIKRMTSFESFVKSNSGLENFKCVISVSRWVAINDQQFEFHIAADRFVRGMVRLCVGACLSYATNKISLNEIDQSIENKKQIPKSWSVPAHGLTLTEVKY